MDWLSRLNAVPGAPGDGVEFYSWNYAAHLSDNLAHRHTFFEICLVGAWGSGIFTVENRDYELAPGDLFIARPGVVHQIRNRQKPLMELFWVSLNWRGASEFAKTAGEAARDEIAQAEAAMLGALADSPVLVARDDGLIGQLWQILRAVAEGAEHAGKDAQLAGLQRALILQIAALGAGGSAPLPSPRVPEPHRLARLGARYIHDNLARKLSVAEVAAHLHLSPRQFQRLFLEFAGTSPAAYIEAARMDRARHLLRASDAPIKAVAQTVGYPDVHHFTRAFGRTCGVSPAAYRNHRAPDVAIVHKDGALV